MQNNLQLLVPVMPINKITVAMDSFKKSLPGSRLVLILFCYILQI